MNQEPGNRDNGSMMMMAMMALCCLPIVVIAVLIPLLGFPLGVLVAVLGAALMLLGHRKFMGHAHH